MSSCKQDGSPLVLPFRHTRGEPSLFTSGMFNKDLDIYYGFFGCFGFFVSFLVLFSPIVVHSFRAYMTHLFLQSKRNSCSETDQEDKSVILKYSSNKEGKYQIVVERLIITLSYEFNQTIRKKSRHSQS